MNQNTDLSAKHDLTQYGVMIGGQLLSLFGTRVVSFAFAVWVFTLTGSVVDMALLAICAIAPIVLISPLAGVIADRAPKKLTLVAADSTLAVVSAVVFGLSLLDVLQPWHLYVSALCGGLASGLQRPLFESITPTMVPTDRLVKVNGLVQTVAGVSQLLAPAIGGAMVLSFGLNAVLAIDLVTFAIAMATLVYVKIPTTENPRQNDSTHLDDLRSGFAYVFKRPGLRAMFFFVTVRNFAFAMCEVLALPLLLTLTTASTAGLILSLSGLGIVVGGGLMAATGGFGRKIDSVFVAQLLTGVAMILAAVTTNLWLLGLAVALAFVAFPVEESTSTSIMQAGVPKGLMGRVSAVRQMMTLSAVPVAMMISAPLAEFFFEPWLMNGEGGVQSMAVAVVGSGPGRGMAAMLFTMGLILAVVTLLARLYRPLVNVEENMLADIDNSAKKRTDRHRQAVRQRVPKVVSPERKVAARGFSPIRFIADRPYLLSLGLIGLVVLWMASPPPESNTKTGVLGSPVPTAQHVRVEAVSRQSLALAHSFTAQTKPHRAANISAEFDGLLKRIHVERGSTVKKGDLLVTLSSGSLAAILAGAKAERSRALLEYRNQKTLAKEGVITKQRVANAHAALQVARAQVDRHQKEFAKSQIRAPFSGIVAGQFAELGDFMNMGQPILRFISTDPIIAQGDVSEREVRSMKLGAQATVGFLNGVKRSGTITYISPEADQATRTFSVEVTLPNAEQTISVGMTTTIDVSLDTVFAHKVSPALLTLNAAGDIQVATVNESDVVRLHDVNVVHTESDGVWVTGLPDKSRLITRGQGFVQEGEKVRSSDTASSGLSRREDL